MIAVVATITVENNKRSAFVNLFNELKATVKKEEKGTLVYDLFRARKNPEVFTIIEHYQDQAAWELHKAASHTQAIVPQLHGLFTNASAEVFDSLG